MSQNEGALPIFLADLGVAVQDGIEVYGKDNIHPGDVFLVNHPEICGQHLNNMVVYTPLFWEKQAALLSRRARSLDRRRRRQHRVRLEQYPRCLRRRAAGALG